MKIAHSPDHEDAQCSVGNCDKADAASQKLQIKNTRDTKGHEGEREKRAEEMLLSEQVEEVELCAGEGKEKKLRVGKSKIRVEGRASR